MATEQGFRRLRWVANLAILFAAIMVFFVWGTMRGGEMIAFIGLCFAVLMRLIIWIIQGFVLKEENK